MIRKLLITFLIIFLFSYSLYANTDLDFEFEKLNSISEIESLEFILPKGENLLDNSRETNNIKFNFENINNLSGNGITILQYELGVPGYH